MFVVLLTLLVCLLVSAAVALFVAYPGRGRPLPDALTGLRPWRRLTSHRRHPARRRVAGSPQEARG